MRHTPFSPAPFRLSMGLKPLDLADWIERDADEGAQLAEKARLSAERHDEVFGALPEAFDASAEVLELLLAHLRERFPDEPLAVDPALHPLDAAGRLVQEDLCVMVARGEELVLGAASLCFPSRWRLREKLGRSTAAIHEPVPFYPGSFSDGVDRVLDRLRVDRPLWRLNWSLFDDPALFQPSGHGRREANRRVTAANAGELLWVRVERQTLRRLPRTGAVLFTIRIHQCRLGELASDSEALGRLAAAVRAMPEEMATYKSLPAFGAALLEWIDARLAG